MVIHCSFGKLRMAAVFLIGPRRASMILWSGWMLTLLKHVAVNVLHRYSHVTVGGGGAVQKQKRVNHLQEKYFENLSHHNKYM